MYLSAADTAKRPFHVLVLWERLKLRKYLHSQEEHLSLNRCNIQCMQNVIRPLDRPLPTSFTFLKHFTKYSHRTRREVYKVNNDSNMYYYFCMDANNDSKIYLYFVYTQITNDWPLHTLRPEDMFFRFTDRWCRHDIQRCPHFPEIWRKFYLANHKVLRRDDKIW